MFTGIVEHVGKVAGVTATRAGVRLVVDPCGWGYVMTGRVAVGDSVSVGGCCLTVAEAVGGDGLLAFDVVPETLRVTNLGEFVAGRRVNLEHAATASTLMGGHVVQGHVDGVGRVESNGDGAHGWVLRVRVSSDVAAYMVPKGSVALDGVSLTLAGVDVGTGEGGAIEVALIPTTLGKTTLGGLRPGDSINVEADVMAKTVVRYLKHFGMGREGACGGG